MKISNIALKISQTGNHTNCHLTNYFPFSLSSKVELLVNVSKAWILPRRGGSKGSNQNCLLLHVYFHKPTSLLIEHVSASIGFVHSIGRTPGHCAICTNTSSCERQRKLNYNDNIVDEGTLWCSPNMTE